MFMIAPGISTRQDSRDMPGLPPFRGNSYFPVANRYRCMHNKHGYYVGAIEFGAIRRMSVEYYERKAECLDAMINHNWTRLIRNSCL